MEKRPRLVTAGNGWQERQWVNALRQIILFVFQVYPSGKMSSYVRSWQIGDMIEWRGPYGNFSYTPNQVIKY